MDNYNVKINQAEGIIEISGADKAWIAEQLDKFTPLLSAPPSSARTPREKPAQLPDRADNGAAPNSETKPKGRGRKRGGGGTARVSRNQALEQKLTKDVRTALAAFVEERKTHWTKKSDQAAIIATFLMDHASWPSIDASDLYTVYTVMGWPSAGNPRAQLQNATDRDGYFGPWKSGKKELSHTGETFGRHTSRGET